MQASGLYCLTTCYVTRQQHNTDITLLTTRSHTLHTPPRKSRPVRILTSEFCLLTPVPVGPPRTRVALRACYSLNKTLSRDAEVPVGL